MQQTRPISASAEVSPAQICAQKISVLPIYSDLPVPSQAARLNARRLIEASYEFGVALGATWEEPLINSTDEAEVLLEWWRDERKLTFYAGESETSYVKVWGPDIYEQMEQGEMAPQNFDSGLRELWKWLYCR